MPKGASENSRWLSIDADDKVVEVKSVWGANPYHQVREYTMSLLNLVKRGRWKMPVFGIVVFPEETRLARISQRIGQILPHHYL